jgi:hypothetical protein
LENSSITTRTQRLADLPAAPIFALLGLINSKPEGLAAVRIRPADPGEVLLEVVSATVAASITVEATAEREITLPRASLLALKRMHAAAERLVVEAHGDRLQLRTFSLETTVATLASEPPALPEIPGGLANVPVVPDAPAPVLLDPRLLTAAIAAATAINRGAGPVEITLLDHPVLGIAVSPNPWGESAAYGSIQLARMIRAADSG